MNLDGGSLFASRLAFVFGSLLRAVCLCVLMLTCIPCRGTVCSFVCWSCALDVRPCVDIGFHCGLVVIGRLYLIRSYSSSSSCWDSRMWTRAADHTVMKSAADMLRRRSRCSFRRRSCRPCRLGTQASYPSVRGSSMLCISVVIGM